MQQKVLRKKNRITVGVGFCLAFDRPNFPKGKGSLSNCVSQVVV